MGVDFAVLPPEVNSGRMYAGAGAGPLMTAAAAWDQLASELSAAAASYRQTVVGLVDGQWQGASSAAMSAAAEPYVAWMSSTAARAEQTAGQARSAAAAYQTAYAATVPPTLVAGNRSTLASLVATNIAGQNTAAIAATEAQYAEMWAQDVAAMYAYAGASAGATQVAEFTPAPPTTSPNAAAAQSAASNQAAASATANGLSAVPSALQSAAAGSTTGEIETIVNGAVGIFGQLSHLPITFMAGGVLPGFGTMFLIGPMIGTSLIPLVETLAAGASMVGVTEGAGVGSTLVSAEAAALASSAGASSAGASSASAAVSAGVGEAASIGRMSVPPTWGVSPSIRLAAKALEAAGAGALPAAGVAGLGGLGGGMPLMGPIGSVVNTPRTGEEYAAARGKALPAWAAKASGHEDTGKPQAGASSGSGPLTEVERQQLDRLRKALADTTKKRDALKRAAVHMIKQAQKQK